MPLTAAVENLGCRVNRVESDRIVRDLVEAGFCVGAPDEAAVVVVNTCAVTGEAEAKTRKAVRRALGLPQRPQVIATGCMANRHAAELAKRSERVCVEPLKTAVAACALRLAGADAEAPTQPHDPAEVRGLLGRSRLGVKVQDGCDNRCTYCIVWKARGRSRSVPAAEAVAEVRRAVEAGAAEVVLTGVNLGRYEDLSEGGEPLALDGLLARVLAETDAAHVRLSSIEPPEVTDALIQVVASSGGRVAPFFHMPLQSGCTSTLKRMGRLYTADEYALVASRIRAVLPTAALSCDVIAGFPGETDEEFAQTLAFCEKVGFARMHVFRYSARPGTVAAESADQVPPEVRAERAAALRRLAQRMARQDARGRVGTEELGVVEYPGEATLASFHRVLLDPGAPGPGTLVRVTITGIGEDGILRGHVGAEG